MTTGTNKTAKKTFGLKDATIVNMHSGGGEQAIVSVASTEEGHVGQKVKVYMDPKEFADHLTTNGWSGDTLILASCRMAGVEFDVGGITSTFAGHLATELSKNSKKNKTITVIAPTVLMGVTEGSGKFYTKKEQGGKKNSTIKEWRSATSTKGGQSTLSDLTQKAADKFPVFSSSK